MLEIPFSINNYFIKEEFENGGSSSIHYAIDIKTNEKMCVKIIEKSGRERDTVQNEIEILKSLKHQNIVSFIDSIETETHFFIFQELCDGKTLFDVIIESRKLEEKVAKKVFHQLIEAIYYLQQKGISHLDIKLENIICSSDFKIKLVDFGFATSEQNLLDYFRGSLRYTAPEIHNFEPYYGMIADMWSCGVILFTILNGYLPFDEDTDPQTVKVIQKCQYSIPKTISKSATTLIKQLLEKNTEKRIMAKDVLENNWFNSSAEDNNSIH
jgi:5'-AMP-activated protein kinase catalytic alpha subunit